MSSKPGCWWGGVPALVLFVVQLLPLPAPAGSLPVQQPTIFLQPALHQLPIRFPLQARGADLTGVVERTELVGQARCVQQRRHVRSVHSAMRRHWLRIHAEDWDASLAGRCMLTSTPELVDMATQPLLPTAGRWLGRAGWRMQSRRAAEGGCPQRSKPQAEAAARLVHRQRILVCKAQR